VCIVPRWGGDETSDWYRFVRDRVKAHALPGVGEATVVPLRPDANAPRIGPSVEALDRALGTELGRTLLIGHGTGCRALLHYLGGVPAGVWARGLLCVAGWWMLDAPGPGLLPWLEQPLDLDRARRAAGPVRALISDDDPYTADHDENRRLWMDQLGAEVAMRPGARHFGGAHEISVLINLAALLEQPWKGLDP
jgi:serine hydrolase